MVDNCRIKKQVFSCFFVFGNDIFFYIGDVMFKKIKLIYLEFKNMLNKLIENLKKLGMIMFLYIGIIAIAIIRIIFDFDPIHIFLLIFMVFYVIQYILVKLR